MTDLARDFPLLRKLNQDALHDARVRVVNQDAFVWVGQSDEQFDAAIIDFPDPGTYSIGKLYTTRFFRLLRERLVSNGRVGIQCTSPLVAPRSFWCIIGTMEQAGFAVRPYRVSVPTFGVWGFGLASPTRRPAMVTTDAPPHAVTACRRTGSVRGAVRCQ